MNTILSSLKAYGRYFLNKIVPLSVLIVLMVLFKNLPDSPLPFTELLYVSILIVGAVVVAPLIRLMVFPEAAEYAESDRLRNDLKLGELTTAYKHYRFATAIAYAVAVFCFSTIQH